MDGNPPRLSEPIVPSHSFRTAYWSLYGPPPRSGAPVPSRCTLILRPYNITSSITGLNQDGSCAGGRIHAGVILTCPCCPFLKDRRGGKKTCLCVYTVFAHAVTFGRDENRKGIPTACGPSVPTLSHYASDLFLTETAAPTLNTH